VEERPRGVVNWEALEENYLLAEQRFRPFGLDEKPGGENREEDLRMQSDLLEQTKGQGRNEKEETVQGELKKRRVKSYF
jgi:hypothetical protein